MIRHWLLTRYLLLTWHWLLYWHWLLIQLILVHHLFLVRLPPGRTRTHCPRRHMPAGHSRPGHNVWSGNRPVFRHIIWLQGNTSLRNHTFLSGKSHVQRIMSGLKLTGHAFIFLIKLFSDRCNILFIPAVLRIRLFTKIPIAAPGSMVCFLLSAHVWRNHTIHLFHISFWCDSCQAAILKTCLMFFSRFSQFCRYL